MHVYFQILAMLFEGKTYPGRIDESLFAMEQETVETENILSLPEHYRFVRTL